jgi:hypothetical protein
MAADDPLRRVQPLTCHGGEVRYKRDPAVEAAIISALSLSPAELIARARNRDRKSVDFLREETVVYFIRAYHAAEKNEVVTALTEELLTRCACGIFRRLRALGLRQQDAQDAFSEVVRVVITAITDLTSGRGDFYQVRFAKALKLKVLTAYDTQLREVKRVKQQFSFNGDADLTVEEFEEGEIDMSGFRGEMADPSRADDELLDSDERAERQALLDSVLGAIRNPTHRDAFVLHRLEGWQITANDPNEPSLVQHFNVKSPKTIYNWIKQAEADIAAAGFSARREEEL